MNKVDFWRIAKLPLKGEVLSLLFIILCTFISCNQEKSKHELMSELHNEQKWNEVIPIAKEILEQSPDDEGVLFALADAYFNIEQYDSSMVLCRQLLDIDSTDYYSLLLLGNNYLVTDNYYEAEECYIQVIKLNSNYARAYINLAKLYEHVGYIPDAVEFYGKATTLFVDNDFYEEGIAFSKHILSLDPEYSKAYGYMGIVYDKQGNYALARINYEKALKLDPTDETLRHMLDRVIRMNE